MFLIRTLAAALVLWAHAGLVQAQQAEATADPLKSPQCEQARDALEAARAAPIRDQQQHAANVEATRKRAAHICLGLTADPVRPTPILQQPIAVLPPAAPAQQQRPPVFAGPLIPPPVQIDRPAVVTACDPGGCWDSNGTRLNRAGPNFIGPKGMCSVQGNLVHCP
jgi:hypothetical protein